MKFTFIILLLSISTSSICQTNLNSAGKYQIDKNVSLSLNWKNKFPKVAMAKLIVKEENQTFFPIAPRKDTQDVKCYCLIYKDTIYIRAYFGAFSAFIPHLAITKDSFTSGLLIFAHNFEPFKMKTTDLKFTSQVDLHSLSQKLILTKKPRFKSRELITGVFFGSFEPFYVDFHGLDSLKKQVNFNTTVYFKCRLKKSK